MRFGFVLLLCLLFACAHGLPNYLGCKTGVPVGFLEKDYGTAGFPSNPVGDCQVTCSAAGATTSVGLGSQKLGGTVTYGCYCDPSSAVFPSLPDGNCPITCPGANSVQGTHCGSVDAVNGGGLGATTGDISVYLLNCNSGAAVCDDPHFTGLDGSHYDYKANPNRVVALISDRTVQVNSLFIQQGNQSNTYMGQVGIRVCDRTMRFFPNGTVVLGEGGGVLSSMIHSTAALSDVFTVTRLKRTTVRVQAGSWRMTIDMKHGWMINMFGISHLDSNDTNVHGAFGITGNPNHHQRKKCQAWDEGGCELPGKWQDYELPVGADLCSTEWTYKQFNTVQCPVEANKKVSK